MIQNEEPLVRFLVLFADRRRALLLAGKHMALSFSLLLFSPAFLTELSSFAYCEQLWLVVWPNMENEEAKEHKRICQGKLQIYLHK